jgi:phospholipid transport system transporter-binding protein
MTTIALPERLTMTEGRATLERLLPLLQAADVVALDASPLRELDSAAVALLLACQRQARSQGRDLPVIGMPPKLRQLAQLYGVDGLLVA